MKKNLETFEKSLEKLNVLKNEMVEQLKDLLRANNNFVDTRPKSGKIEIYCTCIEADTMCVPISAIELVRDTDIFILVDVDGDLDMNCSKKEFNEYRNEDFYWYNLNGCEIDTISTLSNILEYIHQYVK